MSEANPDPTAPIHGVKSVLILKKETDAYTEAVRILRSIESVLDIKIASGRRYALVICHNVSSILQQSRLIEAEEKFPYYNMYTSNGPLLCRSAFKRKLRAISVLVATPKAALNMFQHGFINPVAIHMVLIHAAGSISMHKSDSTSLLCREWVLRIPEINVVLMTSKLGMRSDILSLLPQDPQGFMDDGPERLPAVSFIKYSSKREFKLLNDEINKIRNSKFPGSDRPLLRRIRDSVLFFARDWGTTAANIAFNEFMKRYEEERLCAFTEDGSGVKYQLESAFQSLEGFAKSLKENLEELSKHSEYSRIRLGHFVKHFVAQKESCASQKFVVLVRSKQNCKMVCSLLKKTPDMLSVADDIVELGAKLGTSPKKRTNLMDRAKEGDFTILVTTPALLRSLHSIFKEEHQSAPVELLWMDPSPPSEPLSEIFVLASLCNATSVSLMLDSSHKSTSIIEKKLSDPARIVGFQGNSNQQKLEFPEPSAVLSRDGHARLYPSGAKDLIHRWLSTMPHDRYWIPKLHMTFTQTVDFAPVGSGSKKRPVKQYVCTITGWPTLCPFRDPVASPPAPSRRLARRLALCEALRQLDQVSQFDSSLRPAHQRRLNEHSSDTDFSDFDKKKSRMYSTVLPEIWRSDSNPAPPVDQDESATPQKVIWVYKVEIEGVDATPFPHKAAVGFVTVGAPLPIEPVPSFSIFDHITSKPPTGAARQVHVSRCNAQQATEDQLQQLRGFHISVFKHLLPYLSAVQNWNWRVEDDRSYIIAPIAKQDDGTWSVNWQSAQPWWENTASSPGSPIDWKSYETQQQFEEAVKESLLVSLTNQQVVVGSDVRWDLSPDSKWPFDVKFTSPLKLSSEPSAPPASDAATDQSTSTLSSSTETTPTKTKRIAANGEFYTFRDHFRDRWGVSLADGSQPMVAVRPFAFRAVNVLIPPAQTTSTVDFHVSTTPTKTPNDLQFQVFPELCRRLPISACEFRFFRFLPSIFIRMEGLVKANHLAFNVIGISQPEDPEQRANLVSHFLEALTAPSCSEAIDFEQLETVGDCFLKFIACLDTFLRNPLLHEFQLEIVKHQFVANKTLYEKSVKWNLGCFLNTRHCKVENWVPPGINFPNPAAEQSINDKRVADIFEALLGACYRHGGSSKALEFLRCAGFEDMLVDVAAKMPGRWRAAQPLIAPFADQFEAKHVETRIGYTFKTKQWLLLALMHPSCSGSVLSSQLKFLGDSIIDLYTLDRWMMVDAVQKPLSPGDITDLRAAAVMGSSECAFTRLLGLHEHIVSVSDDLKLHIREYAERSLPIAQLTQELPQEKHVFSLFAAADPPDALSAILEALLGAIYVDSGDLADVFAFLDRSFKPMFLQTYLDLNQPRLALAPVKQLSEMSARRWCTYVQREERQLRLFESARCAVFVHRKEIARSHAADKKEARKKGCTTTIRYLEASTEWWTSVCDCKKPKSAQKAATAAAAAAATPLTSPPSTAETANKENTEAPSTI